jgi:beta-carotene 3-hydroxylase
MPLLLVLGSFLVMEGVSYAAHRWLMHGPGIAWHRSHHRPAEGRFERNDLFPLCFSVVAIALFLGASAGITALWWIGLGITLYGAAYLYVHEVHIHHRLPAPARSARYLRWLRDAHRDHHLSGGEPYGMLLPVVRDRRRTAGRENDVLERAR